MINAIVAKKNIGCHCIELKRIFDYKGGEVC